MTDQEMEVAFEKAYLRWQEANPSETINNSDARYFFWAGSEFGLQSAQQIYGELLKK